MVSEWQQKHMDKLKHCIDRLENLVHAISEEVVQDEIRSIAKELTLVQAYLYGRFFYDKHE